ncbi:MAG: serine protease [Clostridiales bacterium]|nr:serine protease [Clostridiales bacterium]
MINDEQNPEGIDESPVPAEAGLRRVDQSEDIMIVPGGDLPANPPHPLVVSDREAPVGERRRVTRIDDVYEEDHMNGGYATVKGQRKSDNKLLWIVIIVMTIMCCAVGVCSSVLTGYFMSRGADPIKIDPSVKYELVSAVIETRKPCIVEVESGTDHGSGVIMKLENNKIYILTNYHVIEKSVGNHSLKVRFMGDDSWYRNIDILGYDVNFDVAVITISSSAAPFEVYQLDGSECFSRTASYKEGDIVVAIGNAMGHGIASYPGYISRAYELITKEGSNAVPVLRTTAAINAGMSGGALFDTAGRFIGLSTYRMANYMPGSSDSDYDVEDTGYVVPVSIVYPLYKQILKYGDGGQINNLIDLSFSNTKLSAGSQTAIGSVDIYLHGFGGFTAEYRNGGKLTVTALDGGNAATDINVGDVIKSIGASGNSVNVSANICDLCGELLCYRQNSYAGNELAFVLDRGGDRVSVGVDGYYRVID